MLSEEADGTARAVAPRAISAAVAEQNAPVCIRAVVAAVRGVTTCTEVARAVVPAVAACKEAVVVIMVADTKEVVADIMAVGTANSGPSII